jgi:putative phosphoesterase
MKLMFASDIHGSASAMEAILRQYKLEGAQRLVLLGDLLYHGPRNDLPDQYNPKAVTAMLNENKSELLCVRGNCDAEVDQMMFEFPMMSDYAIVDAGNEVFFCTHGHLWNERCLPPIGMGSVLVHGHTHIPESKRLAPSLALFNPGSVSLPKGGSSRSFGYYDGHELKTFAV